MRITFVIFITLFLLSACQQESSRPDLSEFVLQDGYKINLVAEEPLLDAPVAMSFDYDGSIWAVELPGYMRDLEGSDEDAPDGRIVHLLDHDGDGVMDERIVVKDGLVAPRALALVYGGLLYTHGTSLWWDNVEDEEEAELVDSLYVIGGNIEHQPNGLLYNLDNWIYSAKSNARYQKKDGKWKKEATTLRGQWGMTHDEKGRLFYNDNSNPLYADLVPPNVLLDNPYLEIKYGLYQKIAQDRRLYPIQATDVNRGYLPDVLDSLGKVREATSVCGPVVHLGDGLGEDLYGDAFICAPEANAVKRYKLDESNGRISASQAYEGSEFLVSRDATFRPVNLYTGLDGNLYILDMRKGVIQHRAYMTSFLRKIIIEKDLDKIVGQGRIYRVTQSDSERKSDLPNTTDEWIAALSHPNGALRMMAQKYLVSTMDKTLRSKLEKVVHQSSSNEAKIHALWSLQGLGVLDYSLVADLASGSQDEELWYALVHLTPDHAQEGLLSMFRSEASGSLALMMAPYDDEYIYSEDSLIAEAALSGLSIAEVRSLQSRGGLDVALRGRLKEVISNHKKEDIQAPQLLTSFYKDNRTAGLDLYIQHCSSCHGLDGEGRNNLAPPIMHSEYVEGTKEQLVLLLLHGLKGPINVKGKAYDMNLVMPGIKDNSALSDKDIADIVTFVRNSFSYASPWTGESLVTELRERTADRTEMFTEEELLSWKQ